MVIPTAAKAARTSAYTFLIICSLMSYAESRKVPDYTKGHQGDRIEPNDIPRIIFSVDDYDDDESGDEFGNHLGPEFSAALDESIQSLIANMPGNNYRIIFSPQGHLSVEAIAEE